MSIWWHGGAPGLQPGDVLLPRAQTNIFRPYDLLEALHAAGMGGLLAEHGRPYPGCAERVFLTWHRGSALHYAAGHAAWLTALGIPRPAGALYRARTTGVIHPDPAEHGAWWTEQATITAVEDPAVPAGTGPIAGIALTIMRDCYHQWRDEFNDGADHPQVAAWKQATTAV